MDIRSALGRSLSGRTRLATAAAIAVIGITGAAAVGANTGILDSSADTKTGELSAGSALATPSTQVVRVDVSAPTAAPSSTMAATGATVQPAAPAAPGPGAGVQQYAVDAAGTVAVSATDGGVRLEAAQPTAGWSWSLSQSRADALQVTFTNGVRTLEFSAVRNADGTIGARVDEPVVTPAPTASATASARTSSDDEREGHDHEDGEDDDD